MLLFGWLQAGYITKRQYGLRGEENNNNQSGTDTKIMRSYTFYAKYIQVECVVCLVFRQEKREKKKYIYIYSARISGLLARLLFPTQILISRRCSTCICQISSLFFNIYLAVDVVHGTVCQNLHPLFSHYSVCL